MVSLVASAHARGGADDHRPGALLPVGSPGGDVLGQGARARCSRRQSHLGDYRKGNRGYNLRDVPHTLAGAASVLGTSGVTTQQPHASCEVFCGWGRG